MKKLITLCILFCLLSACSNKPTIHIDFNKDTNFQLFSSYQFTPQVNNSLDANPIMINRIQSAVEVALASKGLKKQTFVDMDSADLTIDVNFSQKEKENNSSFSIGLGTSRMGSNSRGSVGVSTSVPINSEADIMTKIVIDMSNTKQAIWHGSDSYEATGNLSMEEKDKAVTATVNRLLASFPP
ncbi:DUF4136 domain-containing protein [Candidatus Colwellia aromaticivorans]|uniref:DUF4136 domain-containing protein n=1 Tax=Candidatus Colwellia aromaticivorans TaxID=2267621 RepID=UPI000DF4173F|nr:DUF4136 domain-containing protein [Candidatus Colwellia aromaticivorans]